VIEHADGTRTPYHASVHFFRPQTCALPSVPSGAVVFPLRNGLYSARGRVALYTSGQSEYPVSPESLP